MNESEPRDPRVRELERRIEELETGDEVGFGHFTRWDWAVCVIGGVALPVLITLRCAG